MPGRNLQHNLHSLKRLIIVHNGVSYLHCENRLLHSISSQSITCSVYHIYEDIINILRRNYSFASSFQVCQKSLTYKFDTLFHITLGLITARSIDVRYLLVLTKSSLVSAIGIRAKPLKFILICRTRSKQCLSKLFCRQICFRGPSLTLICIISNYSKVF